MTQRRSCVYRLGICWLWFWCAGWCAGQNPQCDPTKVLTTDTCVRCHGQEVAQWRQTKHFSTFESLVRNPRASEIASRLGLTSIKRNDLCLNCHFTVQSQDGKLKPIAGISCESCHGASRDWLPVHNDYGGPTAVKATETAEHRWERLRRSTELGMRNTTNVYLIARSCLGCHTVPHESLVNVGGHLAGSVEFELVAWSQGSMRHNFLHHTTGTPAVASPNGNRELTREQLRVMWVAGQLADLEFSTRGTAQATQKATYGVAMAERAARVAERLWEVQQAVQDPDLQRALAAFSAAELRTGNATQLTAIADQIQAAAMAFVAANDGSRLQAIDPHLPAPTTYK